MCIDDGGGIVSIVVISNRSSGNGSHNQDKLWKNSDLLPSNLILETKDTDGCFGQFIILCKLYSYGNIDRTIKEVQDLMEKSDDASEKLLYSNVSVTGVQY